MPKKIIDGLLYDTDKAELMWEDLKSRQIRRYYKTENGNYFCLYGNDKITPMTEKEMQDLLGEKSVETYLKYFPAPQDA